MSERVSRTELVTALKAAAEPTRLRILMLLAQGELNVKDLTRVLGQSQPRLSRHLKLLAEAGLIERFREGSWVYCALADRAAGGRVVERVLALADAGDAVALRDLERARALRRERETAAQAYFRAHAREWDRVRALHVAEAEVEAAMLAAIGAGPYELLVDLGTGTGRVLELLAGRFGRAVGVDVNQDMLSYARSRLAHQSLGNVQLRHGDIYAVALDGGVADAVTMHQVLHYLSEPASAVAEAGRLLKPGGRLLVVDFAPHELEFLRDSHAHVRLGFSHEQVGDWLVEAGLRPLAVTDLAAGDGGAEQKLTVTLWLAERPAEAAPARRRSLALEGSHG